MLDALLLIAIFIVCIPLALLVFTLVVAGIQTIESWFGNGLWKD